MSNVQFHKVEDIYFNCEIFEMVFEKNAYWNYVNFTVEFIFNIPWQTLLPSVDSYDNSLCRLHSAHGATIPVCIYLQYCQKSNTDFKVSERNITFGTESKILFHIFHHNV